MKTLSLDNQVNLVQMIVSSCEELEIDFKNFQKINISFDAKVLSDNEIKFTTPVLTVNPITFDH